MCASTSLVTIFHSPKKQFLIETAAEISVTMDMKAISSYGNDRNYEIEFVFNKQNNSYVIEFHHPKGNNFDGHRIDDYISINMIDRFKKFDFNHKGYRFTRKCEDCLKYEYHSGDFKLDYKTLNIGELFITSESYFLYNEYKNIEYHLLNTYHPIYTPFSVLQYGVRTIKTNYHLLDHLQLPLIKFTTKEKMLEKFEKLVLFS